MLWVLKTLYGAETLDFLVDRRPRCASSARLFYEDKSGWVLVWITKGDVRNVGTNGLRHIRICGQKMRIPAADRVLRRDYLYAARQQTKTSLALALTAPKGDAILCHQRFQHDFHGFSRARRMERLR